MHRIRGQLCRRALLLLLLLLVWLLLRLPLLLLVLLLLVVESMVAVMQPRCTGRSYAAGYGARWRSTVSVAVGPERVRRIRRHRTGRQHSQHARNEHGKACMGHRRRRCTRGAAAHIVRTTHGCRAANV